jgi:hypothetical protein
MSDPVLAVDDEGFTAAIEWDEWLVIGAPATVGQQGNDTLWTGQVLAYAPARYVLAPRPQQGWASEPVERSVTEFQPVIEITIRFSTDPMMAPETRQFYRRGQLTVYATPAADGKTIQLVSVGTHRS